MTCRPVASLPARRPGEPAVKAATFRDCRAILFDFGGTLDADGEHWLDRFFALYAAHHIDVEPADIKRAFYRADELCHGDPRLATAGLRPLMRHHVHLQLTVLQRADPALELAMADAFCRYSEGFLARNATLLRRLRARHRLGVVSNFYGNVAAICAEAGLGESLALIIDSARVGLSKPDPAIFRLALAGLKLLPEQVIFVGDSYERDMIPSRELGMRTVWLKGPNPRIPENAGPVDACIGSLTELEELLP